MPAHSGENHYGHKLDEAAVRDIRSQPQQSLKDLHKKYNYVSKVAIFKARERITWRHVED